MSNHAWIFVKRHSSRRTLVDPLYRPAQAVPLGCCLDELSLFNCGLCRESRAAYHEYALRTRTSTRDSLSVKALAVITAVFLLGDYIGTLFGVSMFNWEQGTRGDAAISADSLTCLPRPERTRIATGRWAKGRATSRRPLFRTFFSLFSRSGFKITANSAVFGNPTELGPQ
ncbi:Uu.00g068370.m01.CDS01 [Anthostomella pinea]|uniref:Uu.00g068370.m01.CDS01 n=1 Tax=Anthostomella pinea TaxID=933095 RepID=A0AAI8VU99_9PEZI|nr:Uu.00g068370.m01.CDS01 [Anthostomella pinea]